MQNAEKYYRLCLKTQIDNIHISLIEGLALTVFDVDDETISEWAQLHPDFSTIKKIMALHQLRLEQHSLDKYSAGSFFFLKPIMVSRIR